MDQSGNNHLLLRATQSSPPAYNGQPAYSGQHAAADRMRELLACTVHDHLVEERTVAGALHEIRMRLDSLGGHDETSATGIAATMDGLAATLGALDSKLTARLERLDDQYDRVRSIEGRLDGQPSDLEQTVSRAVEAATTELSARIASLEDTVLALAEALLRPAIRVQNQVNGQINGHC
jgi:hypothetical protein